MAHRKRQREPLSRDACILLLDINIAGGKLSSGELRGPMEDRAARELVSKGRAHWHRVEDRTWRGEVVAVDVYLVAGKAPKPVTT